jgi:hypothetical protein
MTHSLVVMDALELCGLGSGLTTEAIDILFMAPFGAGNWETDTTPGSFEGWIDCEVW